MSSLIASKLTTGFVLGKTKEYLYEYFKNDYLVIDGTLDHCNGFIYVHTPPKMFFNSLYSRKRSNRFELEISKHFDSFRLLNYNSDDFYSLETLDIYRLDWPNEDHCLIGQVILARNGWFRPQEECLEDYCNILENKVIPGPIL